MKTARQIASALALAAACGAAIAAEPITIGMSAALSGPQARFGQEIERGVRAGLEQANAAGGVAGRPIELVVRDDAGQPERVAANTRALIDAGVLALTAYQGAAWHKEVGALLDKSGVALVGVLSSAELLREPARRGLFNLRAGARDEAAALIYQLDTVAQTEIAVIHQDDLLGASVLDGVQIELARMGMRPQAAVRLAEPAGPAAVTAAVKAACKDNPRVLVLALGAANALAVMREARKAGCRPQVCVTSETGIALVDGPATPVELAGVIVSQVVPHPAAPSSPLAIDYRRQLAGAPGSYAGIEGYLYARVLVEALRRCGRDIHRACVTTALESRPLEVGGHQLQFQSGERKGSRFVEMTIVTQDGRFRR